MRADLGDLLVARNLNVEGNLDWDFNWDVNVLVFGDVDFFFTDNIIWNLLLSINWDWNWLIIVAWLLNNDWNFFVDITIDTSSVDVASTVSMASMASMVLMVFMVFMASIFLASIHIVFELIFWIFLIISFF